MQGMHAALHRDGLAGRRQRLPQYLATKELGKAEVLTAAAIQVGSQGVEAQEIDQVVQHLAHG